MTNLVVLIPIALLLGALGLAAFLWSLRSGQYEDLDGAAERILFDGNEPDGEDDVRQREKADQQ
jgi:cbb3-type cytochrome oxidase maturation protein